MEAAQIQIPTIVMNEEVMKLNEDAEERKALARKMREACESHGYFLIDCGGGMISDEEQRRFFSASDEFFALPDDTKKQCSRKTNLWKGGYFGKNPYSRQESLGIYGLTDDEIRSLAGHMWPEEGNSSFCEVNQSMKMKLMDVGLSVMKLAFEDLGISNYFDKQSKNVTCVLRSIKYNLPPNNNDQKPTQLGLMPHVDKTILSVLFDNGIQGIEILTDDGQWVPLTIPKGSLLVIIGDAFEVWSNGKFRAVMHRVIINGGDKEKYTCALIMLPEEGVVVEVPPELVAEGGSPLFRSFVYSDYLESHIFDLKDDSLKVYAGLNAVV